MIEKKPIWGMKVLEEIIPETFKKIWYLEIKKSGIDKKGRFISLSEKILRLAKENEIWKFIIKVQDLKKEIEISPDEFVREVIDFWEKQSIFNPEQKLKFYKLYLKDV